MKLLSIPIYIHTRHSKLLFIEGRELNVWKEANIIVTFHEKYLAACEENRTIFAP